jgi:TonB family protein
MSSLVLAAALLTAAAPTGAGVVTPVYDPPALARSLRVGGSVTIEALVDEDGVVRATNVVRSQPLLDDEAMRRVLAMRFPPPPGDTSDVATIHTLDIGFTSPKVEPAADAWEATRCSESEFHLDVSPRPDSTGRFAVVWQASGLKSQELFVIVLTPDGVVTDTTGSWIPERFTSDPGTPGWPAWHKDGAALKSGTGGEFAFTVPARTWWAAGRVAVVALFRNSFDDEMVAWQHVWRVERDSMGALLVPDPRAVPCVAGPWVRGR